MTHYDWTLGSSIDREPAFRLPSEMEARLRIEQYINKVTERVYNTSTDPVGLAPEETKLHTIRYLAQELSELEQKLKPDLNGMVQAKSRIMLTF
jgi:hypothetical protein